MSSERHLKFVVRFVGGLDLLALLAVLGPWDALAACIKISGVGPVVHGPLLEYLARSSSAMYALHGALMLFLSTDVHRYAPVLKFLARVGIVHAGLLAAMDFWVGLPWQWAIAESVTYFTESLLILWLLRRARF
jgi:hypothetical protein